MVWQQSYESEPGQVPGHLCRKEGAWQYWIISNGETIIKCGENVTLLGVNRYFMLKFYNHVSELCKK